MYKSQAQAGTCKVVFVSSKNETVETIRASLIALRIDLSVYRVNCHSHMRAEQIVAD